MTTNNKIDAIIAYILEENPDNKEFLRKQLISLSKAKTETKGNENLEMAVHDLLTDIGVPPALMGYRYLHKAIVHTYQHPEAIDCMTEGFYPMLALTFDTTPSRVERAIRNAITKAFDHGDVKMLEKYFRSQISPKSGTIPNAHFIARCAILIRQRLHA